MKDLLRERRISSLDCFVQHEACIDIVLVVIQGQLVPRLYLVNKLRPLANKPFQGHRPAGASRPVAK